MRWSIVPVVPVVLALVLGLGCARHPPASSAPAAGASAPDGSSLRAATLEYSGTHRGDHPDWRYQQTVTIAAAERAGRPVWRRTSTFGADAPMSTVLEIDRATMAAVHSDLTWNGSTVRLDFRPGRTSGLVEHEGARRQVAYRHTEPVVLSDALDLYVAALPLAPGYESRLSLLDFWLLDDHPRYQTRPFTVRVVEETTVTVPAGSLPVFTVAIDPADGDDRLRSTYHVLRTRPHYAVRMEYVVNPATIGEEKRSVGVDELVRFTIQPSGAAARP
ncbi:MAG TPA: hypothetical protein VK698_01160 [Kofleriaceae bacterium]|nr:hypothetical protein [Kofleriaceae bacterium]